MYLQVKKRLFLVSLSLVEWCLTPPYHDGADTVNVGLGQTNPLLQVADQVTCCFNVLPYSYMEKKQSVLMESGRNTVYLLCYGLLWSDQAKNCKNHQICVQNVRS